MNSEGNCIFCKIISKEMKADVLKESKNFIAIRDINPVSEGHLLIIPREHMVTLLDMSNELGKELLEFTKSLASDVINQHIGTGFNLIMNNLSSAGQLVMHAHIHLIPRNDGDGIRLVLKK